MTCTSRTIGVTASGSSEKSTRSRSAQVVEHLLDVLVLLQRVDEPEDRVRVALGQVHRRLRDVLELGRDRREFLVLERLRQVAEVRERTAQQQLRLALLARALAQLLEPGVDQVQL